MNDFEEMNFDTLDLKTIPVVITAKHYFLVEAQGDAVAQWRNAQLAGSKIQHRESDDSRTVIPGGLADSEPLLVSLCLYEAGPDGNLRYDPQGNVDKRFRVPVSTVRGWPNRIVGKLFERVKDISGLDEKDTVESLDKQIAALHKRKAKLEKSGCDSEAEALGKN